MDNHVGMRRLGAVCRILAKEGFYFLLEEMRLTGHLPWVSRVFKLHSDGSTRPERFRRTFESLGGFYIKLGQLLSIRPDLVPSDYCEEFAKLQDRVPPMPFLSVKRIIEQELKGPINSHFKEVSPVPIGSASIAQVHAATLKSGEKVVIKVMRPECLERFDADLEVMYFIAHRLEHRMRDHGFSPVEIVEEFERYTRDELNFLEECAHIGKFYQRFLSSDAVKIPKVYSKLCTKRILVMERLDGVKLSSIIAGTTKGFDKERIAKNLFDLALRQVFQMDIFHADMHPGNIMVQKDHRVGLMDFGITGSLSSDLREKGVRLYVAMVDKDLEGIYDSVTSMGYVSDESKLPAFRQELRDIIDVWHGEPLSQVRVTHVLHQILQSCIDHGIRLPGEFMRLGKALVTVEGTCIRLYPDFNFVEESKPYLAALLRNELVGGISIKSILKRSLTLKSYLERLPKKVFGALDTISKGRVEVAIESEEVTYLGRVLSVASDRLAASLIITACIVSGALILITGIPPFYQGTPIFSMLLFFAAAILSALMILSFLYPKKVHSR